MNRLSQVVIFCAISVIWGCQNGSHPAVFTGEVDGHRYELVLRDAPAGIQQKADSLFGLASELFSLHNEQSVLSRYNAFERTDTLFCFVDSNHVFGSVFDLARELHAKTSGYYDPSLYPIARAWQIMASINREAEPDVDSLMEFIGFDSRVDLLEQTIDGYRYRESQWRKADPRIELDFGTLPFAYTLDLLDQWMSENGMKSYRLKLDSITLCRGDEGDTLNLRRLLISDSLVVNQRNTALVEITEREKFWLIDPATGSPVRNNLVYVAIMAPDAARAQCYATTFMTLGLEGINEFYTHNPEEPVDAYIVFREGNELLTASTTGFDAAFVRMGSN